MYHAGVTTLSQYSGTINVPQASAKAQWVLCRVQAMSPRLAEVVPEVERWQVWWTQYADSEQVHVCGSTEVEFDGPTWHKVYPTSCNNT